MTTTIERPVDTLGMHHVAMYVKDLHACRDFYVDLLGMKIEWQPDEDNIYLTSGTDNVAIHKAKGKIEGSQRLDHIGFILKKPDDVDQWHTFLIANNIKMHSQPKTHRDGARSFYCEDPGGTIVQMIYHPPLSDK